MGLFWPLPLDPAGPFAGDADRASGDARAARRKVDQLEARLERAMLTCEAMWSLLRDKLGVTDIELAERINQLDLADGKLDGRVQKTPVSCPSCGRTLARRFPKCIYCGQPIVQDGFA